MRRVRLAMRKVKTMRSRREVELYKILVNGMYGLAAVNALPLEYSDALGALFSTAQVVSSATGEAVNPQCLLSSRDGSRVLRSSSIILLIPFGGVIFAASFGHSII